MATLGQELFEGMAALHGSVRTTRIGDMTPYAYSRPLNDFALTLEVDCVYWQDDDGEVEVEIKEIAYRNDEKAVPQRWLMPKALFSESALAELRDEIAGEIECELDDEWLAREER